MIQLNEKLALQLRALLDNQEKLQQHINSYMSGAAAALNVPDGWIFDVGVMGFIPGPEDQSEAPAQVDVPLEEVESKPKKG